MTVDMRWYWLWLQERLGVGDGRTAALLRAFEHPRRIYEADKQTLYSKGVRGALLEALSDKSLDSAEEICETALRKEIWMLTPDDTYYPQTLTGLSDMPTVLFGRGDFPSDWDARLSIAVVGTRKISDEGRRLTAAFTAGLCAGGAALVTGVAQGSDETVLQTAIACGGLCVAVMAGGVDTEYPRMTLKTREQLLERGGVLLSEYAPGVQGGKGCYHVRNRLISGLCAGTLLTEVPEGSGALITGRWAREQGRDVFVIPGHLTYNEGGHQMVREGAQLVTSAIQIAEEYRFRYRELAEPSAIAAAEQDVLKRFVIPGAATPAKAAAPVRVRVRSEKATAGKQPPARQEKAPFERPQMPQGISEQAQRLFALLSEQPQPLDGLSAASGLTPGALLSALTELEMTGTVQNLPGGNYCLKG